MPGREGFGGPAGRALTQESVRGSRKTSQFMSVMPDKVTRSVIPFLSMISWPKLMWPMPSTRMSRTGVGLSLLGRSRLFSPSRLSSVPICLPSTKIVA
jgi:hypothetical protein